MMKRLCRVLALVLVVLLLLNSTAFAAWFAVTDYHRYTPADWAREAVVHLMHYGIINREYISIEVETGFTTVEFYQYNILRSSIAYVLVQLYEFETGTQIPIPKDYPLAPPEYWYTEDYVKKAYGLGLMQGVSPTDFGYTNLTRQEFAVVLYRAAKIFGCADVGVEYPAVPTNDADYVAAWAQEGVRYAYYNGYMTGVSESEFAPKAYLTKEMAYTCLHRFALKNGLYEKLPDSVLNEISFGHRGEGGVSIDELCLTVSDEQAAVVRKAIELFPEPYAFYATIGDYEREEISGDLTAFSLRSEKGDFYIYLTRNGIRAGLLFSVKDYAQYEELIYDIIKISRDKDIFLEQYESVRFAAGQSENGSADSTEGCLDVDFNWEYGDMEITISDYGRG